MGWLRFLRKLKVKEKEMRVLVLGLDNAGKSSVIKASIHSSIESITGRIRSKAFNTLSQPSLPNNFLNFARL
jgi:GTPase SAR1 family protein